MILVNCCFAGVSPVVDCVAIVEHGFYFDFVDFAFDETLDEYFLKHFLGGAELASHRH